MCHSYAHDHKVILLTDLNAARGLPYDLSVDRLHTCAHVRYKHCTLHIGSKVCVCVSVSAMAVLSVAKKR